MEEVVYHNHYKLEDFFFWFKARNAIVLKAINKFCELKDDEWIIDVGCGTGGFTAKMAESFNVAGIDTSDIALDYCRMRGLTNVHNMLLSDVPKDNWNIKALTILDVTEHIEDDISFINQAYELLPKGGWVIATVPAYQWLWSGHDVLHQHYRRYSRPGFKKLFSDAGFNIRYSTYFNTILFAPAAIQRIIQRSGKDADEKFQENTSISPSLNSILGAIFMMEKSFIPGISFPFGLSILVAAQK
jgi:SAM-dependent methyltransferase